MPIPKDDRYNKLAMLNKTEDGCPVQTAFFFALLIIFAPAPFTDYNRDMD
jgi:hypothetical protein